MNIGETVIASGLGLGGAAAALLPISVSLPIAAGKQWVENGIAVTMATAVIAVALAFMSELRKKDKLVADRFKELTDERKEIQTALLTATATMGSVRDALVINNATIATLAAEHRGLLVTIDTSLRAIDTNTTTFKNGLTELFSAIAHCKGEQREEHHG
jgi:hypothetical protein